MTSILLLAVLLIQEDSAFLLRETFDPPALTPGVWEARIEPVTKRHVDPTMHGPRLAGFDTIGGGYLHFWSPGKGEEAPSLTSLKAFDRVPGRCLAVAYCGTVHRGPGVALRFAGGPGWAPAQRQGGPFINSAAPIGEGFVGHGQGNNNVDTLFLVVLRERGAFYLMADGPRARLCAVTETGSGGPYPVALQGGDAHSRFHSVAVADLPPSWIAPAADGAADAVLDARITPGAGTTAVGLVARGRFRFELGSAGVRWLEGERELAAAPRPCLAAGKSQRLTLRIEGSDVQASVDDVPVKFAARIGEGAGKAGIVSFGKAPKVERFVVWPCAVDLPRALVALLPPVVPRADGEVVIFDDFEGAGGPLEGRTPKVGTGAWQALKGDWTVEGGAAKLARAPGFVTIETGLADFEVSATIEMRGPPEFPAVLARVDKPRASSWITARYLWQSASPEIEVWDQPGGDGSRPTILINATNITGLIRPGEKHVLRLAVRGNRVSYFRDDLRVGTSPTRALGGTRAGLEMAGGGNADCRWLDFTVRRFR